MGHHLPYFPGMFFVQGGLVELSGLDSPTALNLLVPILGAFAVVPMFLIAQHITGDDRVALFAAAFLMGAIRRPTRPPTRRPPLSGPLGADGTPPLPPPSGRPGRPRAPPPGAGALVATHHLSLYFFSSWSSARS